jgi:hypothetical protein
MKPPGFGPRDGRPVETGSARQRPNPRSELCRAASRRLEGRNARLPAISWSRPQKNKAAYPAELIDIPRNEIGGTRQVDLPREVEDAGYEIDPGKELRGRRSEAAPSTPAGKRCPAPPRRASGEERAACH